MLDVLECAVCSAPAEEVDRFTLGGTSIADMRTVRCANGHRYNTAEFIDDPTSPDQDARCWAHSRICACSWQYWTGMTHRSCDRPAASSLGLCPSHHLEISGA